MVVKTVTNSYVEIIQTHAINLKNLSSVKLHVYLGTNHLKKQIYYVFFFNFLKTNSIFNGKIHNHHNFLLFWICKF